MLLSTVKGSIPLYMQIKELLVARISGGLWSPGDIIPSEMQLSRELGVSQGTVRKAITELVDKNVLKRKQGRGTFVANHDSQRALFHFFHIADNHGHKLLPDSTTLSCRRKTASRLEATRLQLAAGTTVVHIRRVRTFKGQPTMLETVTLPAKIFGSLGKNKACDLPNMLYEMYEKQFSITIHSAEELLRAVAASKREAALLNLSPGAPLLEIERVALTLNRTPIELRISRCNTDRYHYQNTLF
ncbi:MAG: GntR family transcriptional regulator [Gammaproteobacteria bacterium]|nr:GntR family transcriptional regulator [Gammaproteobacteria bacterium]